MVSAAGTSGGIGALEPDCPNAVWLAKNATITTAVYTAATRSDARVNVKIDRTKREQLNTHTENFCTTMQHE